MDDTLIHVPLTPGEIQALLDRPRTVAGRQARDKLRLFADGGLWLRLGMIWRRSNGRRFIISGFGRTVRNPTVKTQPLSEGGRPSENDARRMAMHYPDPLAPALLFCPPPAPWQLHGNFVDVPGNLDAILGILGSRLYGMQPGSPGSGAMSFELDGCDRRQAEGLAALLETLGATDVAVRVVPAS